MGEGAKVIKDPKKRAGSYSAVAAVLTLLAALGIINADEIDAEVLVDSIVEILGAAALVMARLNVWLRKPQLPAAPPPH